MMYFKNMIGPLKNMLIFALLTVGLLVPKVSALALHLNPNIMAIVICTGTDIITIHIGADGQPVEASEAEQAACVLSDPNAIANRAYAQWTLAPRSYRATFVENENALRSEAETGLLPCLRGPPFVI